MRAACRVEGAFLTRLPLLPSACRWSKSELPDVQIGPSTAHFAAFKDRIMAPDQQHVKVLIDGSHSL